MLAALTPRQRLALSVVAAFTAASGVMHYGGASGTATFPVVTVALAGVAWIVSLATHALATHFGP